ncbi:MAG: PfkB family carbohydrate kinase [Candidatus Thiodiazotropha sp.]
MAQVCQGGVTPTSYIISSQATGSRTIVHYRKLPEYDAGAFSKIDITPFHWLHFEGRNPQATEVMMRRVREIGAKCQVSLELEKPQIGLEKCLAYVDVVMISRAYALCKSCQKATDIFDLIRPLAGSALLYLAWGDEGGWLQTAQGACHFLSAVRPTQVVDTLGAGDVFNAGVIHSLQKGDAPLDALQYAIQIAGEKCARQGI